MKHILIILTILGLVACKTKKSDRPNIDVKYFGSLKSIMHEGDLSSKAHLKDFSRTQGLYAIGAIKGLKGEIQIFNGLPQNSMLVDGVLAFDSTFQKEAALLVCASVSEWVLVGIPDRILTYQQLEGFIEDSANANYINTDSPFPFLIEGVLKRFDWHVINWKEGDKIHTHEKHINSGYSETTGNRNVVLLGFYSNAHQAIFTHHTTNMHIHVRSLDGKVAGHLDDLLIGEEMILKLPIQ